MSKHLRTEITYNGQRYVDEPVYVDTKPVPLAYELAQAFGRDIPPMIRNLDHHKRIPLRWMEPDSKGGLKPAKK